MSFTVLVADDEPLALSLISSLLEDDSELQVVSVCKDGREAATALRTHTPDIALLDIEMPGLSGLELAEQFATQTGPKIILMSPSTEHACRSYELNVLDYLLKPVKQARFQDSLTRTKKILLQDRANQLSNRIASLVAQYAEENTVEPAEDDDCFVTRTGDRLDRLEIKDIIWIEASNQYLTVHTHDDSFVLSQSLSRFLERYGESDLCRVHRSHAVNLQAVTEVHKRTNGQTEVRLVNGTGLIVSRSRQNVVPTLLKWAHDHKKRRAG